MRGAKHIKMTKKEWQTLKRKQFRELYKIIINHDFFYGAAYLPRENYWVRKELEKLKSAMQENWNI